MKHGRYFFRLITIFTLKVLLIALSLATSPVLAGVIDTLPQNCSMATSGSLAQGGTFVADDEILTEFTIQIGQSTEETARPIVLGTTDSGAPTTGPVLWEGPDVTTPFDGEITFFPDLPLTVGERYFIGLDYGFLTSVDGGIVLLGCRSDDPIPDGQAWRAFADGWDPFSENVDIAARIVMTPVQQSWQGAYSELFDDQSDLDLLRQYRDNFLIRKESGRLYTKLLYRSSEEALEVLLTNPKLMLRAEKLIEANKDAVAEVVSGNRGVIYNTDEIVSFLDAYARKSSAPLKLLAITVKREMLEKQEQGEPFLGLELH